MLPPNRIARLKATLVSGVGMLVLGMAGALIGSYSENELATCFWAAGGMLLGGFTGGWLGSRWSARATVGTAPE